MKPCHVSLQRSKVTNQGLKNKCRIISLVNYLSRKPCRVVDRGGQGGHIKYPSLTGLAFYNETNLMRLIEFFQAMSNISHTMEVINLGS